MAGAFACCGGGEGLAALMQVRSRPSPGSCGFYSIRRNSKRNVEVRVAADYSDSKPESFDDNGKWGYHPLEDLSKGEKEEIEHAGDGRLTNGELARTISEVNWSAFIYSTVISDKDAVFGTEVQYLVDDHGDLYFEIENDNEFLRNLSTSQIYTMLVGFGNVDGLQFSEVIEEQTEEGDEESDSEGESSDESETADAEIYWEGMEGSEGDDGDSSEESFGSLGGWGGFESLDQVHPMDFASKVSESVAADYTSEIDKPVRRLSITGVARRITEEEEPYVQGIWYDRFLLASGDGDDDDDEEEDNNEVRSHHGDNAWLAAQKKASDVNYDGGRTGKDHSEGDADGHKPEVVLERFQNGIVFGDKSNGMATHPNDEDVKPRSRPLGTSEISPNDPSVIELSSSSASMAEDLDAVRDSHRDGSDALEDGIVSRELGARKNRKKKRGSRFENSDVTDEAVEAEASEVVLPPGATLDGDALVSERTQQSRSSEVGSSFYKLDIVNIQLEWGSGVQLAVDLRDFAYAEPDILAHFALAIIERVNGGGEKTENALKALCQRAKGLDVEEVSLVGLDCLGIDLRAQCGIEVQTLRIPFSRRATCEDTADRLLDQLLFPRSGQRRSRKRGQE